MTTKASVTDNSLCIKDVDRVNYKKQIITGGVGLVALVSGLILLFTQNANSTWNKVGSISTYSGITEGTSALSFHLFYQYYKSKNLPPIEKDYKQRVIAGGVCLTTLVVGLTLLFATPSTSTWNGIGSTATGIGFSGVISTAAFSLFYHHYKSRGLPEKKLEYKKQLSKGGINLLTFAIGLIPFIMAPSASTWHGIGSTCMAIGATGILSALAFCLFYQRHKFKKLSPEKEEYKRKLTTGSISSIAFTVGLILFLTMSKNSLGNNIGSIAITFGATGMLSLTAYYLFYQHHKFKSFSPEKEKSECQKQLAIGAVSLIATTIGLVLLFALELETNSIGYNLGSIVTSYGVAGLLATTASSLFYYDYMHPKKEKIPRLPNRDRRNHLLGKEGQPAT